MHQIHDQEKEQLKKLFQQEQIDQLDDRIRVLEVFLQTERHVTLSELVQQLVDSGTHLESDFVRDTLRLLCHYGFAQKNRFDNGEIRYEHRHLGYHHDHMICTKCHHIIEFRNEQLEALQQKVAVSHGFHMLQHKMEIYGICADCLQQRMEVIPLIAAKQGERLIIKDITGGAGARMRLIALGLRRGDEIDVVTNQNQGRVVIAVDNKRLVIGQGLAQKIMVAIQNATPT